MNKIRCIIIQSNSYSKPRKTATIKRTRFVLTFFLFLTYSAFSQTINESVNYINYSIKDGLPSSETYDIYQDSKGYIWIGTDNGVVRFDGANFETFTTRDGLTDNTIFKIQEDYLGRIWFLTYNRKLCYYEDGEFIAYKFNDVLQEATEDIFIGISLTDIQVNPNGDIELVLVNMNTVNISNKGEPTANFIGFADTGLISWVRAPTIKSIIEKTLYKTSSYKVGNKFIVETSLFDKVHFYVQPNKIVVGTNHGLELRNKNDLHVESLLLREYTITGYIVDFEGGIWCSSLFNGIFYIPNPKLSIFKTSSSKQGHIHAIVEQNESLFFCYGNIYSYYHFDTSQTHLSLKNIHLDYLNFSDYALEKGLKFENPIFISRVFQTVTSAVRLDSNKTLFACDKSGVKIVKDTEIKNSELIVRKTSKYLLDSYNQQWFKTEDGDYLLEQGNSYIINHPVGDFFDKILKLFKDADGLIWIGSINGLFHYNPDTETVTKETRYPDFQNKRIQDITESSDGTLFFATKANGIFIASNNEVTQITEKEDLLGNTVNQMIYEPTSNEVWVATNKGICKLQKKNNKWISTSEITKYDGLETPDIRQIYFYDNYLYFANNTGVGRIKVSDLNQPIPAPLFNLTNVIANDSVIGKFENIRLRYDSNNIQINYQAIGYKSQNQFTYSYRMNTGNFIWQTTTNSNITLTTLPPGKYEIQIKATNVYGVDSEIKEVTFEIVPAFWMTLWFKVGILIIAVIIGYRASINTIRVYRNQAKFHKTINELQVASLQSKMSPHFIFNSLNSIQNFILKNEPKKANDYLLEFSRLIRIILQNSDVTSIVLDKELEILQMYVDLERKRLRSDFGYIIEMDEEIDRYNCLIPSLLIQPYIENSIWHGKVYSNPEGEIKIIIKKEDEILRFEIRDNGIGVANAQKSRIKPMDEKHESIGTSITKKRIQLLSELNNQISEVEIFELYPNLVPNNFVGTCVRFNIPYILKKPKNE